jgi:hypothetical protein
MDNPTKENLIKLLDLIEKLSQKEEHKWFKDELSNKFSEKSNIDSFPEYFKAQRLQYKIKAKNFYSTINDKKLKLELINDYVEMSWHQSVNNIDRFLLFVFYQMENLINYYCKISNAFEKLELNKDYYTYSFNEKFNIITYDSFYFRGNQKPLAKINIWAKLTYWMHDSDSIEWESKNHFNLSNLINIRNKNSHRNSEIKNEDMLSLIESIKKSDITAFSFYVNILKQILKSFEKVNPKLRKLEIKPTKQKLKGLSVKGKIDLAKYNRK